MGDGMFIRSKIRELGDMLGRLVDERDSLKRQLANAEVSLENERQHVTRYSEEVQRQLKDNEALREECKGLNTDLSEVAVGLGWQPTGMPDGLTANDPIKLANATRAVLREIADTLNDASKTGDGRVVDCRALLAKLPPMRQP